MTWPVVCMEASVALGTGEIPAVRVSSIAATRRSPKPDKGNIGCWLVERSRGADAIGRFRRSTEVPNVLQGGITAVDIVNLSAITAVAAGRMRR